MPINYLRTAVKVAIVYVSLELRGLVWAGYIKWEVRLKSIIYRMFVKDMRADFIQECCNRGESLSSTLNRAKTAENLQPISKGRVSIKGKLLRRDIKDGGFLLNWHNRILAADKPRTETTKVVDSH